MLAHAAMIGDGPYACVLDGKFKNKGLSASSRARGALCGGGTICTADLVPRHQPSTPKVLRLISRPTFCGPFRMDSSISSQIRFHSTMSKAAPGSMATISAPL
jgi:hypothetical protein